MKKHYSFTNLINYIVIAFISMPLFSNLISIVFGGVVYAAVAYLLMLLVFLLNHKKANKSNAYFFFAFILFLVFISAYALGTLIYSKHFGNVSLLGLKVTTNFYNFILSLPLYISCFYIFFKSESHSRQKMYKFYHYCLLYTISITLVALIFIPEFSTNDAAAISTGKMRIFYFLGASGYSLSYSLAIILPVFFYFFVKTKRLIFFVIATLGTITTIKSGFLIATLVLIINYFLCLVLLIKNNIVRRGIILILLSLIIFFAFNMKLIGKFALFIANNISISSLERRLVQISNAILYNDFSGDALAGRIDVYMKSIQGIQAHPIFGSIFFNPSFSESGHSTLMDAWACFGILFLFVFLGILAFFYLGIKNKTKNKRLRKTILVIILCFTLVALLDPILASATVFIHLLTTFGFLSYVCEKHYQKSTCFAIIADGHLYLRLQNENCYIRL